MKMHPRTMIVQKAQREADDFMFELLQKHKLTSCEYLGILTTIMQQSLRSLLRVERHPDKPDTPADSE